MTNWQIDQLSQMCIDSYKIEHFYLFADGKSKCKTSSIVQNFCMELLVEFDSNGFLYTWLWHKMDYKWCDSYCRFIEEKKTSGFHVIAWIIHSFRVRVHCHYGNHSDRIPSCSQHGNGVWYFYCFFSPIDWSAVAYIFRKCISSSSSYHHFTWSRHVFRVVALWKLRRADKICKTTFCTYFLLR